jgi:cytochrome c oxidase cbb3-type subunit 3
MNHFITISKITNTTNPLTYFLVVIIGVLVLFKSTEAKNRISGNYIMVITESTLEDDVFPNSDDLSAGAEIYEKMACFACHGMKAQGNQLGPNLIDNFALLACSDEDVIKIITKGVKETSMLGYENQLTETQIKQVAAYIKSLKGTAQSRAKAPEGDKCS